MDLPSLQVGTLNRASGFARYPGGKGLNVSRVVRELGERTLAFGLAGGEDGMILRSLMNRLALPHDFLSVLGSTRNNYKIRTRRPRAVTEVNMPGPVISRAILSALQQRLLQHRPIPQVFVLSGSLPPGVPVTIYRRWIAAFRRLKVPAVLDASGEAFREGVLANPWLIKPNRQEAEELLGSRLTRMKRLVDAARRLLKFGPSLAILSMGKDGALMASRRSHAVWLARPPSVKTDSAVGAGDSLVGGFLVGWIRRLSLVEAFRLGVACGTATAVTPGTELCHRRDIERFLPRVVIRQVG